MLITTIDTCTDMSTIGLVRDGAVLAEIAFPSRHTLARRALLRLDWLLTEAGVSKQDIEAIAVSLGPGSFTGVRIGLAAAKTLAYWLRIPLLGIPTLEAIVYSFREVTDTLLVPVINARRQQLYSACFVADGRHCHRRTPDMAVTAEAFAATVHSQLGAMKRLLLLGQIDGVPAQFRADLPNGSAGITALVTPRALAALAEHRLANGDADDPMTLAPIYLRGAAD